jgi:polysaccharide chain length determinant protein (PEP-CTERM system associated)
VSRYTPEEVGRTLAKRRWIVLFPLAVGIAAAPLLAPYAPARYRSETLIMVVPQRVPESYVKPTVTENIEDRLPSISEQILSRTRLERIIQEMNLYQDLRARMVMEDVVEKMRADIVPSIIGKDSDAFRISYTSDTPETARKVTERLASLYIEQNLTDRGNQAESTSQFIETQLQDAKQRLIEQERKLEEYRKRHAGQLPSQVNVNLQAIQSANQHLQSLTDSNNRALERRLLIERQIADTQSIPLPPSTVVGGVEAPPPASPQQQLDVARVRLNLYLQRYTPDHPEVVSLKRTIEELTARVEQEMPIAATPAEVEVVLSPAEAAQKKRILDLQAELAVIGHQLTANQAEEKRLKALIANYQAKVDTLPTRESELVELTRDYSTLQTAYTNLLMKREDSVIAANLERRQIGEQFRILDPASTPQRPYNQTERLAFMSAAAGAGLLLGLLIIAFLEYRDSSFRREEEVFQRLSLPVLALVPVLSTHREKRAIRRRTRLLDVAAVMMLVAATAVVVYFRARF